MKNFENPLRFDKVMVVSLVAYFFDPSCLCNFVLDLHLSRTVSKLLRIIGQIIAIDRVYLSLTH